MGCLLGAFDGMWEYVKSECIAGAIKGAEGIVGVDSVKESVLEAEAEERAAENKDEDDDDGDDDDPEDAKNVDDSKLVQRWKKKGFEFLMVHSNKVDRFRELASVFDKIKVTTKVTAGDRVKKAASRINAFRASPKSPKNRPSEANSPSSLLPHPKSPKALSSSHSPAESGKLEAAKTLLWDSSNEIGLRRRLRRWVEDALETDSLVAFGLGELWEKAEGMLNRSEEHMVDKEIAKVEEELKAMRGLDAEAKRVYGGAKEESVEPTGEKALERREGLGVGVDLSVLEDKDNQKLR